MQQVLQSNHPDFLLTEIKQAIRGEAHKGQRLAAQRGT
jgi:hypothetical protein